MKIWRYMDLAKFISLLSNRALYFSNASKFNDPYEFFLNEQYMKKFKKDDLIDYEDFFNEIKKSFKKNFAVTCWHINEYENEALWKIYTNQGQGIAIETTNSKLKKSLNFDKEIKFSKVKYEKMDIKNYIPGVTKRKAFEYEKEYRGIVFLNENEFGESFYIKTDLDILIEKIHISPLMPKYFSDSIKYLCQGELSFLQDRIVHSKLYDEYENN
ncbi:DUF2971 domain-containing protein [Aliarcobacter skirrowii]|uniref:DUF2971 domain-containing protein n=1 Tax=Aliarcobacter skirrowii TaxID=28200 RepID=UPI0029BB8E91|nr:DUF2971 domain-containing protein [Aliarcobacter skirrowii]MDX4026457.1 DUF2971 domain-containing protein [Aliarcobacter skirrowii]